MPAAVIEEDIVVSGMSGRFPECDNVEEFRDHLMKNKDMTTVDDRRWPVGSFGLPKRSGKLRDLTGFDAEFFNIHSRLAEIMDPQMCLLLETIFETIVDAGLNPTELRGSRTGVFVGCSFSELNETSLSVEEINKYPYLKLGTHSSMLANRISYAFDFKGPSSIIESDCSSFIALHNAVQSIKRGESEMALVAGSNLMLSPNPMRLCRTMNLLSEDGICRSFDDSGTGTCLSEAIVAVLLQKSRTAKRVYATILNSGINCNDREGGTGVTERLLVEKVYRDINLSPSEVYYIETHSIGKKDTDATEANWIDDLYSKGREKPLLIGSIKSNMGFALGASGLTSLVKLIIAMESGVIPANLHFDTPNQSVGGLKNGRLQVVDKNWAWNGGIAAINSFSSQGVNVHVVLKSHNKQNKSVIYSDAPKLICASGRTQYSVEHILKRISEVADDGRIALVHNVFRKTIPRHSFRGYTVLNSPEPQIFVSPKLDAGQVWYVFAGVGSQDLKVCQKLMELETFRGSFLKCASVLSNVGYDLLASIEKSDDGTQDIFDIFIPSSCAQVALIDTLSSLGLRPDGIIGHSSGELACAYADGAVTLEQVALGAYALGKAFADTSSQPGAMAALGLTRAEATEICLKTKAVVACHNSANSVTIAGPRDEIHGLVKKLKGQGILAKELNSLNIAFHSPYTHEASQRFLTDLEKIIPSPKRRSSKWLSTAVAESEWNSENTQLVSPSYFATNISSPVLFNEASSKIPANSLIIEISPRSIFQGILRLNCPKASAVVGLTSNKSSDHLSFFLSSLGRIYSAGLDLNLDVLYPPLEFPVHRGTPSLSSLIKWDHSVSWRTPSFNRRDSESNAESVFSISLEDENYNFLEGHRIDGRVLVPATAYLNLVWQKFSRIKQMPLEKTAVIFENVNILRPTTLTKEGPVKFTVNVSKTTGKFEVTESGSILANGFIRHSQGLLIDGLRNTCHSSSTQPESYLTLSKNDVYKELRLRGYEYQGDFKGIVQSDNNVVTGTLTWNGNWIIFMDLMLQYACLGLSSRQLHLPTKILKCIVDPGAQACMLSGKNEISVQSYRKIGVIRSGGVEIRGLKTSIAPRRNLLKGLRKIEEYKFVPYELTKELFSRDEALNIMIQIALENCRNSVKTLEIRDETAAPFVSSISNIVNSLPLASADFWMATPSADSLDLDLESSSVRLVTADIRSGPVDSSQSFDLVCGNRLTKIVTNVLPSIKEGGFILTKESPAGSSHLYENEAFHLELISRIKVEEEELVLIRKCYERKTPKVVFISSKNFEWVESAKTAVQQEDDTKVLLVATEDPTNGIIGMFNCIKQEPGGDRFRVVFTESPFDFLDNKNHLRKDLLVNVFRKNTWGSMRHLNYKGKSVAPVEHAFVNSLIRGDLSSLRWLQSSNSGQCAGRGKTLCTVYYAPLNFKDIMLASGKLPPDGLPGNQAEMECIMGLEFSGRDSRGCRVMGFVEAKALATSVMAIPQFLWEVPSHWSLEQASTVPTVYATCIYALIVRGNMKAGDSLLVHGGSGGIGQAAINLALHLGVKVYTTVGSQAKREFLLERFPELKEDNIGNSRDATFEQWIMEVTNGRGVDIVLNSLADDKLHASVRCLAEHGRFLEIGKLDMTNNSTLGLSHFLKNVSFHGILLDSIFGAPEHIKSEVNGLMQKYIDCGAVKPLLVTTFDYNSIEQAFRFMASGKHIGKVVVKIKDEENESVVPNAHPTKVPAIRKTYFCPNKTYLIIGGLGGFGLELCNWMLKRGAGYLILTSRSGVTSGHQTYMLRRWSDQGHKVRVESVDITQKEDALKLIQDANKMGPVGGIFNLAAVLSDGIMVNLTKDDFRIVCKPKISTTLALDEASRHECSQLDHFVVFSSVACGRGNKGQANYAFANSSMERICENRHRDGFPGMAIQWGAIGDVGMAVEKYDADAIVGGTYFQNISSCLETLDFFLQDPRPVVASCVIAEKTMKEHAGKDNIITSVEHILGVKNLSAMTSTTTLGELGVDSLMAAEIRHFIQRTCDIAMSADDVRNLTVGILQELSNKTQWRFDSGRNNQSL